MRHRPALLAALLAAMLVTPACAKAGPVGVGALGTAREAAWGQASAAAGQAALSELLGGARELTRAEAGLDPIAFTSFDKDANGKLSLTEQATVFKTVWNAVQEATEAKQAAEEDNPNATDTTTYKVAHPLILAPTEAELFIDAGEILPAVYQTIASAKKTIYFDLFLLGGAEGLKLAEVLAAKAKEGIDVRVIHDPGLGLGGTTQQQVLKAVSYLQAQGVAVKMFPLRYLKKRKGHPLANRFQIDHNKFLVVDGETAMIGTMNLIDIGTMNHDVFVRLTGEAARELQAIHEATWALKGPKTPDLRRVEAPKQPDPVKTRSVLQAAGTNTPASLARVIKTDIDQQTTKRILLENIKNAKKSVHVAIFEFGDMDVARALVEAYKRGVDVRVLSDKNAQYAKYVAAFKHLKIYGTPNLLTMNHLREAGVPVKWFVPQTDDQELHMKVAMFDGERAIVGSTNFTYQAFNTFRETSVEIVGGPVPARLEAMFEKDWASRGAPVVVPTFFERTIMTAVKYMDKFNLSWW